MAETKFEKIKRLVDEEKSNKVRGEARIASLSEEKERIFNQITTEVGHEVTSVEEVDRIVDDLKTSIAQDIEQMEAVLKEEGILV